MTSQVKPILKVKLLFMFFKHETATRSLFWQYMLLKKEIAPWQPQRKFKILFCFIFGHVHSHCDGAIRILVRIV